MAKKSEMVKVPAAVYARYSSAKQNDTTIETQLQEISKYADSNNYEIDEQHTYIDRAQSAKTDDRPSFQKMLADAKRGVFDVLLVYKNDRFSRDLLNALTDEAILNACGVTVISVTEPVTDDYMGLFFKQISYAMAQLQTNQSRDRIKTSMHRIIKDDHRYMGGNLPLGYKVSNKEVVLDEKTAPIAKEILERIADGEPYIQIANDLNSRGIKTTKGNKWRSDSFDSMMTSKKYIGQYTFGETVVDDVIPRLITDETYEAIQKRRNSSKHTYNTRKRTNNESQHNYLLTGKLFCGQCGASMTGHGTNHRSGRYYGYYEDTGHCGKKNEPKEALEKLVAQECYKLLTDDVISLIATKAVELSKDTQVEQDIKLLKKALRDNEKKIENILDQIENGNNSERLVKRLDQREEEARKLKAQIRTAECKQTTIDTDEIEFFLYSLRDNKIDTEKSREAFIDAFVQKVYVYDDKIKVCIDFDGREIEIDKGGGIKKDGVRVNPGMVYQR